MAIRCILFALSALPLVTHAADAANWPVKPIRLVMPFAAGGSSDLAARVFSQRLSERLGQTVVVDNRGSAGGIVGAEILARSAPDGYTLGLGNVSSQTGSPLIFANVTYHPVKSFSYIAFIGTVPAVLLVHPSFPARSVDDLVKMAKAQPGKINYGSGGNGTLAHIMGEMFKLRTGIDMVHVPYRGAAFMMTDLRTNAIPVAFDVLAQAFEPIKAGFVRPLALASPKRVSLAPDIPTFVELGYKDFIGENWLGFLGPAGVPHAIVERLHREVMLLAKEPDIAERLARLAITHQPLSPEEFKNYVATLYASWGQVVKAAKITVN